MQAKPKTKVEEQAKRRWWVDTIKSYLIIILMCLVIIGIGFRNPITQLAMVIGLFASVISDFVLYTLPDSDEPLLPPGTPRRLGSELHERVNIVVFIGTGVFFVLQVFLPYFLYKWFG